MSIEIQNVGPVRMVSIPVPEEGGVVVLRGRNGTGKSYTLGAVDRLVTGKGELRPTDGKSNGSVEFGDAKLSVGRSIRRSGELEVVTLDGRLSIADLVDPGLINSEAADAKRIKALVTLVGRQADPSLFYGLFGGKAVFDRVVSDEAIKSDDLVSMVARVKKCCEKASRNFEDEAAKLETEAVAFRKMTEGLDATDVPDSTVLQAALEDTVHRHATLKMMAGEAASFASRQQHARNRLREIREQLPQINAAVLAYEETQKALQAMVNETVRCREALARCEDAEREAAHAARLAAQAYEAATADRAMLAEVEALAVGETPACPSGADLQAAEMAVDVARGNIEKAAILRDAADKQAKSEILFSRVKEYRRTADWWRTTAKATEEILTAVVQEIATSLRVEEGRLVTHGPSRGETFYSELSHGERWKIAMDIAISAVGSGGLITVPQEAWEGLDPDNRRLIYEHVRGTGVVVLTAEADEQDLHAEVFGE